MPSSPYGITSNNCNNIVSPVFILYSSSFVGTLKNEIPGAALELCQLKLKQFSPDILKFSTKHEDNPFSLNCVMVTRTCLFTFNLISWNSYKICKKEAPTNYDRRKMNTKQNQVFSLLLIEHLFSKKTTKQKTKRRRSVWVKPWLKSCMYTHAFNSIFAELRVNDKKEFRQYLRINTATYHCLCFAWQNNRDVLYYTSLPK